MSWMPSADPLFGDKRSCDALELVVVPRVSDLGNGFAVRRAMPNDKRQLVGPFIFFDQMGRCNSLPDMAWMCAHTHICLATKVKRQRSHLPIAMRAACAGWRRGR